MESDVRTWFTTRRVAIGIALLLALGAVVMLTNRPSPASLDVPPKAGRYTSLTPGQRRLIDDWVGRLGDAAGKAVKPQTLYDDLALSTRTTFTAVTHALSAVRVDAAGGPANATALDLIESIDTVAGSAPGQGGDKQFRLYVLMRPGAQAAIQKSGAFKRQVDNTVYHKGYPTCFRGIGGTPSIQISLARDSRHADIDVDYRSSTFPVMLINGHLTASNSDVRAGNNDERHNQRWSGLQNWWRGFMGVPAFEAPRHEAAILSSKTLTESRLGKGTKPEDAVHDFLHAWLIEGSPGVAVGYVAPRAFACLELERGETVDRGVARIQMARAMESVARLIGKPSSLADAVQGVALTGSRGKEVAQEHRDVFAMYELRDDLAAEFDCENRLHPEQADQEAIHSTDFSGYIGAVFRVQARGVRGETVATVWGQDKGVWKLVAYDVEPEVRPAITAVAGAVTPAAPAPVPATVQGDPAMTRSAQNFLDAWFVRKDIETAFRFLSPESYACYDVFRSDDVPPAGSSDEAGRLIKERMTALAGWTPPATRLEDVLVPVEPQHADLRLVHHESTAFSVIALPEKMGAATECAHLTPGETPEIATGDTPKFGRYYATSTRLKRSGPDAGVLWLVWARQTGAWQVVSYLVLTP